jgi:hypothetical protein
LHSAPLPRLLSAVAGELPEMAATANAMPSKPPRNQPDLCVVLVMSA